MVLNKSGISQNFKEKNDCYLMVSKLFRDFNMIIPIDLIVYTKDEYQKFIELKSNFSKEIASNSIEIL